MNHTHTSHIIRVKTFYISKIKSERASTTAINNGDLRKPAGLNFSAQVSYHFWHFPKVIRSEWACSALTDMRFSSLARVRPMAFLRVLRPASAPRPPRPIGPPAFAASTRRAQKEERELLSFYFCLFRSNSELASASPAGGDEYAKREM